MRQPQRTSHYLPRLLMLLILTLVLGSVSFAKRSGLFDQLNLLVDVRHELVSEYVETPDEQKMTQAAVRAMVESLEDPYTVYLSPQDLEPFDKQVRGTFSGIGAEVDIHNNHLRIVTPLDDSPAWKAGIMAGDIVLEVDGESLAEVFAKLDSDAQRLRESVKRLQGLEGSKVRIKVRHASGQEAQVVVTRAQITVQTVRGWRRDGDGQWTYMLDPVTKIGYIRLSQFTDRTANDLRMALDNLQKLDVRGLVLDMRFNPGGLLDAAVQVSDLFLDGGKRIVSVKGRHVPERVQFSTDPGTIREIPLVVLANEASASAAEVVTGALADNGRAQFIGTRTFGKGSVQQIRPLEDGAGALKITNAYYYLPNGRNIHRRKDKDVWGVDPQPGYWVPMSAQEIKEMTRIRREGDVLRNGPGETQEPTRWTAERIREELKDRQLAAGLEALQGYIATGAWPVVGQDGTQEIVQMMKRDTLQRQRDLLEERLAQVEKELAELGTTAAEPAPVKE